MRRVLVLGLLLAGCASGPPPAPPLTVLSPEGFLPALRVSAPAGWAPTAGAADGFALAGGGERVSFVTPPEGTARDALAAVRSRAGGTTVDRAFLGQRAAGLQVAGGSGLLLESAAGTVTVSRGAEVTVLALDVEDAPLLVAVEGPLSREVDELLAGVRTR